MNYFVFPINSAAWMIGALVFIILCSRVWQNYKNSGNYLSYLLIRQFIPLMIGFALIGLPIFSFFRSEEAVRYVYIAGDFFRLAGIAVMSKVFWFIGFQKKFSYLWLAVPTALLCLAAWLDEIFNFYPHFQENLVILEYPLISSLVQIILLTIFGVITGFIFLSQGIKELRRYKKIGGSIKSFSLGIGYILVPGSVVLNNLINRGSESVATSIGIIAGFVILLAGLELPQFKSRKPLVTEAEV